MDTYPALETAKKRLKAVLEGPKTFGELSSELSEKVGRAVSKGAIYKFVTNLDYDPTSDHLRKAFDLPHMKPAPACGVCGEVHTKKTCPTQNKKRKPNSKVVSIGKPTPNQEKTVMDHVPDERLDAMMIGFKIKSEGYSLNEDLPGQEEIDPWDEELEERLKSVLK